MKDVVILGGPNGAGKTTAAKALLPEIGIGEFVNADEIARGLSPYGAEHAAVAAGRSMLARIRDLVAQGTSFAFEATCSGPANQRLLRDCKAEGWRLNLLFLWLPSSEAALDRVARRVLEGGHAISPDVVVRRCRAVFPTCASFICLWRMKRRSTIIRTWARLIAEKKMGSDLTVHDEERWAAIARAAS